MRSKWLSGWDCEKVRYAGRLARHRKKEEDMIGSIADTLNVSTTVVWALFAVVAVQLVVQIWALVDLARRQRVRFDKKWVWALVIIIGGNSFLGPIIYAAGGRSAPGVTGVEGGSTVPTNGERTRRAVNTLYGEGEER